ncbi:MAG: alkaline phosphatase family protein, partial [Thermonemataceae bacterium]
IDWLVNALAYSKASFKVVALGNQVLNPAGKYEGLINFKEEYDYLLQQITKAQIEGVLFISGDRHHTELTALMQADFYPLYDLTVSPLTSGAGNPKNENNTLRVANTLVAERNFAIVEVSGKLGERILTIQIYDKNNQLKWSKQISQQSLQLKKK